MKLLFKYLLPFIILSSTAMYAKNISLLAVDEYDTPVAFAKYTLSTLGKNSTKQYYSLSDGKLKVDIQENVLITISGLSVENLTDTLFIDQIVEGETITFQMVTKVIELETFVVSGQIGESNINEAIQEIKVISEQQIINQGAVNLKDVLTTQQNVRLSQDLILGPSLSLMGVSGQNVKIMVDGIPVIGRQGGNIDLSQINLNNVKGIEIIEGPMSVNYGSDALAGTINIITKKEQKDTLSLQTIAYYETIGQYNLHLVGGKTFKNSFLKVSAGRNFFNGWSEVDTSRSKDWKPKEQYLSTIDYIYCLPKTELRFKTDFFHDLITNRGNERAPLFIQAFDDTYKTTRVSNSLFFERPFGMGKLKIVAGYNYFQRKKNTYNTDLTTLTSELVQDQSEHDTSSFSLIMSRGTYHLSKDSSHFKYEVGYDIEQEVGTGKRILNNKQSITNLATFGNLEWRILNQVKIRPGLRFAYNSAYKAPISPSLNVKLGNKKHVLRASYARGFRAPSLKDLYFNFVDINHNIKGNPGLQAEYSNNYQLHYTHHKKIKKNSHIHTKVGTYFNDISNLITLAQTPNSTEFSYQNVDIFKTKGVQTNFAFSSKKTEFGIGLSYIGRYNQLSKETNADRYSYSSEATFNGNHQFTKINTTLSVFAKYQGELQGFFLDSNDELVQSSIAPFTYLDASLNKAFFKKKLTLVMGVKNLLDITSVNSVNQSGTHSNSTTSTPISYGRTYFTTLNLKLAK